MLASRRRLFCAGAAVTEVDGLSLSSWIDVSSSSNPQNFSSLISFRNTSTARKYLSSYHRHAQVLIEVDNPLFNRSRRFLIACKALFTFFADTSTASPGLLFQPVPRTGRIVISADATNSGRPEKAGIGHHRILD
ncbi:hypothetical protein GQX74_014132 [Glossina fuscipes]|nr:hypothetical protein GQX74_014132 [Glossina fuscipes]